MTNNDLAKQAADKIVDLQTELGGLLWVYEPIIAEAYAPVFDAMRKCTDESGKLLKLCSTLPYKSWENTGGNDGQGHGEGITRATEVMVTLGAALATANKYLGESE